MYYNGPNGANLGGVYTSPYQITVNGVSTYLVCDDATADINGGLSWTANEVTLPEVVNNGPQKFTGDSTVTWPDLSSSTYTIQQQYDAAAYLATEILNTWQSADAITTGELSFAIWNIFDPGVDGYFDNLSTVQQSAALGYEEDALNNHSSTAPSGVIVYTPVPPGASQEFIGYSTPEVSTLALLAFNFFALLGIISLLWRLRRLRNA
jgi:hypothetical protein